MSSARHFAPSGTYTSAELKKDIETDIAGNRAAQQQMQHVGNHDLAARMGEATDEALDELNAANNGTWRPRHA